MAQRREKEAENILSRWHAAGDRSHPIVQLQMNDIRGALESERKLGSGASYLDMFKTKGNRRRLLITLTLSWFSQWGGNGVVSFYLTTVLDTVGITESSEQLIITASLQIWNLICGFLAASFVSRLGKRPLFHASAAVMLLSYICITGLSGAFAEHHNKSVGVAVVPFLFIYFSGYGIAL
jgi:Na+/melibiose symporter-like transporter